MKRIISVLLLSVMLCGILASCGGTGGTAVPMGMKLISGENDAYNLFVPERWIVNNSKGINGAYHTEADMSNISVTTFLVLEKDPVESTSEIGSTAIPETSDIPDTSVATDTASAPDNSDTASPETTEAAEKSKTEKYIDRYWKKCVMSYSKELNGFKIIEQGEKTKLGGLEAKKYVYSAVYGGEEYKMQSIITAYGGLMYVFTYTAKVGNFDGNIKDVNWIISEFKFKDGISG
jgi:hypothetical protein